MEVDEYLVPLQTGVTLLDAMHNHVLSFSQSVVHIPIFNFQARRKICAIFSVVCSTALTEPNLEA